MSSLGLLIRKLRLFKCRKMSPISNTGSVPKTVTWYWHFVCTETIFRPSQNGGVYCHHVRVSFVAYIS